jgi:hypothetical protein
MASRLILPSSSTGAVSGTATGPAFASSVERMLQINMALLIVLGTVLLAMGQQNIFYALVAIVGASASVFVTDIKGWFRLSQNATTSAALLACAVLVVQVIRNVDQSHLLNVANVLIYLEMILLFQQKDDRAYWSLMSLSLLQVVVAVALNLGLLFGLLLGVYVLAAFSALVLFYVVRETRPYLASGAGSLAQEESTWGGTQPFRTGFAETSGVPLDTLEVAPLTDATASRVLQLSLVRYMLRMLALVLGGTFLLFFAIPRYGESVWQGGARDQVVTVGFTEEVRLDNIGQLLENPEQVMRVEFTSLQGMPYQVDGEPYFRGSVLSEYRGRGIWKPRRARPQVTRLESEQSYDLASTVEQSITLQQGSHSVLFNVAPCYFVQESPGGLFLNADTRQLMFGSDQPERRGSFRYRLGTTAFRNGWQRDLMPAMVVPQMPYLPVTDEVRTAFPGLTAEADRIVGDLGPNASVFDKAKALEAHFRAAGVYRYSLEVNRTRDRALDPMEDFVVNHRTGHCEYFAGALTLMLRSQQIPARMVVGFKGGEYNTVGNYYTVRQLHAHAWVEAYLQPEQIPADEWDASESREDGAWLRLDPTPGGTDFDLQGDSQGLVAKLGEVAEYVQVLWDDYVLGLNATRQQQFIYGPLVQGLRSIAHALFSPQAWRERIAWGWLTLQRLATGQLISWPLLLPLLAALAALGWWAQRTPTRWLGWIQNASRKWWPRGVAQRSTVPRLDLYAQLEQLLAEQGWRRPAPQTPAEFARVVREHLASQEATAALAEVPARVTAAYYRVRYGAGQVAKEERRELLEEIRCLEQALTAVRSFTHSPASSPPAASPAS